MLRQLADSMPQIVFAARPDGVVDYFNRRWYEYTGFPTDAPEGEAGDSQPFLFPHLVARHQAFEPVEIGFRRPVDHHGGRYRSVRMAVGLAVRNSFNVPSEYEWLTYQQWGVEFGAWSMFSGSKSVPLNTARF